MSSAPSHPNRDWEYFWKEVDEAAVNYASLFQPVSGYDPIPEPVEFYAVPAVCYKRTDDPTRMNDRDIKEIRKELHAKLTA